MSLIVLDPLVDTEWDHRISGLRGATFFHSRAWAAVLAHTYGFQRQYAALQSDSLIRAVLPIMEVRGWGSRRRAVALPFSDYVPAAAVDAEAESLLLNEVIALGLTQGWQTLELRSGACTYPGAQPSARYFRHEIELLANEDAMFKALKTTVRTAVRKSEASDVSVVQAPGNSGLAVFRSLNERTRRRHGLPPQPSRFFAALDEFLLQPQLAEIWLAMHKAVPIAAAFYLVRRETALFKYGCSDERFQHVRANDLLMWRAICTFAQRGLRRLCLGRTDYSHEGLRRYKLGFGAREELVSYYKYDYAQKMFTQAVEQDGAWYNGVFRHLPLWMNRWVGNRLYRFAA